METNFEPSFKEKGEEQFYYKNGTWLKCSESHISYLWNVWSVSKNTHRYIDDSGFLIFGNYINKNININE